MVLLLCVAFHNLINCLAFNNLPNDISIIFISVFVAMFFFIEKSVQNIKMRLDSRIMIYYSSKAIRLQHAGVHFALQTSKSFIKFFANYRHMLKATCIPSTREIACGISQLSVRKYFARSIFLILLAAPFSLVSLNEGEIMHQRYIRLAPPLKIRPTYIYHSPRASFNETLFLDNSSNDIDFFRKT